MSFAVFARTTLAVRAATKNQVLWPVKCLPSFLSQEYLAAHGLSLPFDVLEMLAVVLAELEGQKLRDAKPGLEQRHEDREVPHRMLVGSGLDVNQLLGGRLEPRNLDVLETFPFRVVEFHVINAGTGPPG